MQTALLFLLTLFGALWAIEVQNYLDWAIFKSQFLALIYAIAMAAVFLGVKSRRGEAPGRVPLYDWILIAASVVTGGFVLVNYPTIQQDLGTFSLDRIVLGTVAVLIVIEATRRVAGWSLIVLFVVLILYTKYSDFFPGILNAPGARWSQIPVYLYLDTNGLFGLPLDVTATMIIAFILFGRMLYAVHGDQVITDFAMVAMGRYRGGSAKVAIVASSLFGTSSGSAVSNVAMDGPITIPMMRASGYPSHLAAAIEAVASTGGQIMPPVMGITAFIIAEYLSVPYGDVVLAALIPALLYYAALFLQVDLEAGKRGLSGLPRSELPPIGPVLQRGWVFVVPICVLLWALLFEYWQAGRAAMAAAAAVLLIGMLRRDTRPDLRRVLAAFTEAGQTILGLVVITAIAGIVIGLLQLSGLSYSFSMLLIFASKNSLFVLLILTAIVCVILGMGMPTAVIYMMLAVVVAPAMIEFGVPRMAAHLFLFYFGMLSMITPPICLATFAAASIAETSFWKAGWSGMRLGIVAYIVPFVMIYQPALVFEGSAAMIAVTFIISLIGIALLAFGIVGFLFDDLSLIERGLFITAGLALLIAPIESPTGIGINAAALGLTALLVWRGYWLSRRGTAQRRLTGIPT